MRRGELWSYFRPATPDVRRTVVLLSGNGVNHSSRPWLLGIEVRSVDPNDLLGVPIGDGRFAHVEDLGRLYRAWIGRREGLLDSTTLRAIDNAIRSALDL